LGSQATCYSGDLATEPDQSEPTQQLIRDLPHVDVLIQNAATYAAGLIEHASLAEFDPVSKERPGSLLLDTSPTADAEGATRSGGVHQFE
jgi:hypothetical protein